MRQYNFSIIGFAFFAILFSCKEEDFDPATVTFYPTLSDEINEPELGAAGQPVTISLKTSRVLIEESQVNIRILGNGAGYGASYSTYPPQLTPGVVTITIPAGEIDASFQFTPLYDGIFEPTGYQYTISIDQYNNAINSTGQGIFTLKVKDSTEPFLSFDFENCSDTPAGLTEAIVPGAQAASAWGCTNFGFPEDDPTKAAEANAFGKGAGTSNSYLILPVIDGADYQSLFISMEVYSRFSGAGVIKVKYSTNYSGTGNPEATNVSWTELTDLNSQLPGAGSRIWKNVSALISNVPDSNVYIAIQYVGGTNGSASSWRIDNLQLKGN